MNPDDSQTIRRLVVELFIGREIWNNGVSYTCSTRTNGGHHCCSNKSRVRRDIVEPVVLRGLKHNVLS